MKLASGGHLSYCTNIHPGESWAEVRANLEGPVLAVKRALAPARAFGVGLRLSGAATQALRTPAERAWLKTFLSENDLYVFTINAFPYGPFHGTPVKERVYRPDWQEEERVAYSDDVASVLADLLPAGVSGSISTVPGCFKARAQSPGAAARMGAAIARHAATLWRISGRAGRTLALALEPEPECVMETTADATEFLRRQVFAGAGLEAFSNATGLVGDAAQAGLRAHVGVCLDACHAAVEFEEPVAAVNALAAAGISIFKLQVSAGLQILNPDPEKLRALEPFAEGVYLHQVVVRRQAELQRIVDLPEALRAAVPGDEWRVHFHVPLFREALGPFQNTQPFLRELLAIQARAPFTDHLEVETYTWDVLPEEHRRTPVDEAIARELTWTRERLHP